MRPSRGETAGAVRGQRTCILPERAGSEENVKNEREAVERQQREQREK